MELGIAHRGKRQSRSSFNNGHRFHSPWPECPPRSAAEENGGISMRQASNPGQAN